MGKPLYIGFNPSRPLPLYANDAAAVAAGLGANDLYVNSSTGSVQAVLASSVTTTTTSTEG